MKPLIQRKKRWTQVQGKKYITFLLLNRRTIYPFLVNERIIHGKKMYILYDGNNRTNALLDFVLAPLSFMKEIIPTSMPEVIQERIMKAPLADLLKKRLTLRKFLSTSPTSFEITNEMEDDWDNMLEVIAKWEFSDISISLDIAENISDERMRSIYEATNLGGTPLTQQEILASSTFDITFDASDTTYFYELYKTIQEYYGDINNNERLQIAIDTHKAATMNLFEILIATQLVLHRKYSFIPEPSTDNDKSLDLTFKVFEFLCGGFTQRPTSIHTLIESMLNGCEIANTALNALYDSTIGLVEISKYRSLSKNTLTMFLVYVYYATQKGVSRQMQTNTICRIILFHELLRELPKDGQTYIDYSGLDCIEYSAGGSVIPDKLRRIRETAGFEYVPTSTDLAVVLQAAFKHGIQETPYGDGAKKRKLMTRCKAIAMSAFYNHQIPASVKESEQQKDHIVPYSSISDDTATPYDICRLGNLQLIPSSINGERGISPITDAWIAEKGLLYQHYPSESEYSRICTMKRPAGKGNFKQKVVLQNIQAFNEMCEKREELYMKCIKMIYK